MRTTAILASAIVAAGLFAGCDNSDSTSSDKPKTDTVQKQVGDAVAPLQNAGVNMAGQAKDGAANAADAVKEGAANAGTGIQAQVSSGVEIGKQMSGAALDEANKMLSQVQQYIKDNKWELADTTLTKLEGMTNTLPASITDQLPNLRKAITAGKSMTIPGM